MLNHRKGKGTEHMICLRLGLVALLTLATLPARAEVPPLPDLAGPVILTVTGLDPANFAEGKVELDQGRLEAIGKSEITTTTIWNEGSHHYTGVMLRDLITALGIGDGSLHLHALNDYAVEFPAAEATPEAPLLSYHIDGVAMTVRDKGPIWVIFPFDDSALYRTDTTYSRSIWQLDRIDVMP